MKEYVIGLFALSIVCAMVELLSPEGEGGGMVRHIKWVGGLCLLCVLCFPLAALLQEGGDLPEKMFSAIDQWLGEGEKMEEQYQELWQDEQQKLDLAYAQDAIEQMICREFGLLEDEVSVLAEADEQEKLLTYVRVGLSKGAIWTNTHQVEEFIQKMFGCESSIYLE